MPEGIAPAERPRGARPVAALVGAVEALAAVALPFGILVVAALIAWAGLGATAPWFAFVRGAADVWLLGHGVDVRFVPPSGPPFPVTVAALGPALVTLLLGVRSGRRCGATAAPGFAVAGALLAVVAGSAALLVLGASPAAAPSAAQALLLPPLVFLAGLLPGLARERGGPLRLPAGLAAGLRAGAGATVVVLAAAALAVAVSLGLHLTGVVGLYESVGAGIAGGLALTVLQIVLLPTVVVWAAAWFTGAGFALGTGSSVGPLGTALGPLPSLPLFGALPRDPGPYGLAGVLVPVLAGFVCALLARRRAGGSVLLTGLGAGLTAGALLGVLAAAAAGAAGPGRLAHVGPDPLHVAALAALEVGLPALLGAAFGRRPRAREEPGPDTEAEVPR